MMKKIFLDKFKIKIRNCYYLANLNSLQKNDLVTILTTTKDSSLLLKRIFNKIRIGLVTFTIQKKILFHLL